MNEQVRTQTHAFQLQTLSTMPDLLHCAASVLGGHIPHVGKPYKSKNEIIYLSYSTSILPSMAGFYSIKDIAPNQKLTAWFNGSFIIELFNDLILWLQL